MFIKYEAEVSSRVGGGERGVVDLRPYGMQKRGRIACTECKDAAYCYGCSAVCVLVCESATLSVGHNRELCKNG